MFKWFMAKTLITKIIIVTSSVVVIGGATAGAIIIPKQIEIKKEEQRQEQIKLENEEDLANMNITLSKEKVEIPLNGVTQGITIERYPQLEEVIPVKIGDEIKKDELTKVLIEMFVENYSGGELTVDFAPNINESTRGDYPVTFTVTSEKGNTKTATATITVWNFFKPNVYVDKTEVTITKGTQVDIMQGVTFDSNLPEEEQGYIEATGTVDTNTVGTYEITYTYIPKENTGEVPVSSNGRIYKVIEKPGVKLNTTYTLIGQKEDVNATLILTSATEFTYHAVYMSGADGGTYKGTYTIKGNKVVAKNSSWGEKYFVINNNDNTFMFDPDIYDVDDGV